MKALKIILFLLLALIAIFLLVGLLKPSVSYGHTITVDKSVKEAWGVTQDESKYAQWLEGFKSMELIKGEKGTVGSQYKVIVNPGEGQEDFEMIETVKAIKEYESIEMHFDSDMMDFEQIITFKEKDRKTTVSTDSKVLGKGIMMKAMFALMEMATGSFTASETNNMEALKVLIDENSTDYYPVVEESSIQEIVQ